jgi:hypothetical protein
MPSSSSSSRFQYRQPQQPQPQPQPQPQHQREQQREHQREQQRPAQNQLTPEAAAQLLKAQDFQRFRRLPPGYADRCCWGLLPKRWFTCHAKGSAQIDVFARFAFPLMFVVFNLAYWFTYVTRGDDNVGHN